MKKKKSNSDPSPLQVLILEDNPADAELIERQLRQAKIVFSSRLVEGKREFNKALAEFQPQVILSDFKLPTFNGLAALQIAHTQAPDVPFIFVSGSIGEEKAIEMLALGASDYILKDNLARLGSAVKRVIKETHLKLEKKKTDEELRRHVEELRLLAEAADHFIQINDLDKMYKYLAQVIRDISGADYLLFSLYDEKLQAVRPKIITGFEPFRETICRRFHIDPIQMVFYLKDMRQDDFSDFVSRRLLSVRDGLYGLSNRKMPRSICRAIEKLLDIGSMHTMGFSWENQLYGGVTLFFKKNNELKNPAQIETLTNQAAVSIKRLLAEQALRESEAKYRTLVTQSPDGIFIIDLQGNFLSVNQAMCSGMKYSEAELLSLKIWDIVPGQNMDFQKERLADILKGRAKNEAAEYMVKGKDGETHYVAILSAPYYKDNELIGLQGIARDITEKKKMEIRLRESEEYYRTLVETSPDAIIIVDAGGRCTFASSKVREVFGIPAQISMIGASIMDFVEPGEIPKVQARLVEILSGRSLPEINEYRLLRHDRKPFWAEVSSAPLQNASGRNIGLLLVCRDINARKQAEERIQYQVSLLQNVSDAIIATDKNNDIQAWNQAAERIYGWKAEETIGKNFHQMIKPEYCYQSREEVVENLNREGAWSGEIIHHLRNGKQIPVQSTIAILKDASGGRLGLVSVNHDISERKQAEEQLRERDQLLKNLSAQVPGMIYTFMRRPDGTYCIPYSSNAIQNIFGVSAQDVTHDAAAIFKPILAEDQPKVVASIENSAQTLKSWQAEYRVQLPGQPVRWMFGQSDPVKLADGSILWYGFNTDITERKQAEELIHNSLKEKEVLLQEIHHRVKNNLQIISGLLTLQAEQSAGKSLDEIFQESQDRIRSIALIHEKLYRSHNLAEIAFDEYLRTLTENLFLSYGVTSGRVTVSYEMESVFFTIEKAIPLGLIVNELVTNALKHAFPAGRQGEIRIELHGYKGAKSYAQKTDSGTLHYTPTCELIVADNGVGLPAGQVPEQEKTLGMKLVSMLAKQLQAELKVKIGPGTEFRLLFPGFSANKAGKDKNHGS